MNIPSYSSMSTEDEEHYYFSRLVLQRETIGPAPGEEDNELLPISFYLVKQSQCWDDEVTDFTSVETSAAAKSSSSIVFSSRHHRRDYNEVMPSHLCRMGVPFEEQPTILAKLFDVAQTAVPGGHILVLLADLTLRFSGSFNNRGNIANHIRESPNINVQVGKMFFEIRGVDYHTTTDGVALQSFETYQVEFIPAARSSIEGLKRMKLDSLEEDTIKQNLSCSICMDEFAQGGGGLLITPLPCTHLFHAGCLVQWLETSHVCPLCRYALPRSVSS